MKKILIVDDDPGIRKLVDATLRTKEYQISRQKVGKRPLKSQEQRSQI